ncbi:MAG: NAD-dependent protein deacylase, partial [Candidatus Methanofastidiosa archaeon]|nr:NAD-dependent protein deacylase [Candidatus Methanofastidiosa archaeon]
MNDLKKIASLLKYKKNVALTGAGISQESGIPTFRGKDGLWKTYNPEELATKNAFIKNPELFWDFYNFRRNLIKNAMPNDAHLTLASMEKEGQLFSIVTQNVDRLHIKAGSVNVIEIHGNIWDVKCESCGKVEFREETSGIIKCSSCGEITRPDVVLFGESVRNIEEAFSIVRDSDNI